jgi:hypothetical protein
MNLLLFLLLALLLPHCGSAVDADLSSKFLQASVKEANGESNASRKFQSSPERDLHIRRTSWFGFELPERVRFIPSVQGIIRPRKWKLSFTFKAS